MTYIVEKPIVQTSERQLITIEFAPKLDPKETEYSYPQPLFVFGEQVTKHNSSTPFTVCGMELVEFKTPLGQLLNQPYWKYKVDNGQEKIWLDESALVRYSPICSQCPYFQNYQESNGHKHHLRTNDCDLHSDSDPIDVPHSRFAIESLVKVIDPQEHHTEWATFTVIARRYNTELHRNTEAYLNEAEWLYQLAATTYETIVEPLWVAENNICAVDESHIISTEDIF
jgi:hypothetical protein